MVGTAEAIERCRTHPPRPVRCGSTSSRSRALEATLRLYPRSGDRAARGSGAADADRPAMRSCVARSDQMRSLIGPDPAPRVIDADRKGWAAGAAAAAGARGPRVRRGSRASLSLEELAARLRAGEPPVNRTRPARAGSCSIPRTLDDEGRQGSGRRCGRRAPVGPPLRCLRLHANERPAAHPLALRGTSITARTALIGALTGKEHRSAAGGAVPRDIDRAGLRAARTPEWAAVVRGGCAPGHERFRGGRWWRARRASTCSCSAWRPTTAVMPQTREHMAVLRQLGVDVGVVAITKVRHRASRSWRRRRRPSWCPGAPVVAGVRRWRATGARRAAGRSRRRGRPPLPGRGGGGGRRGRACTWTARSRLKGNRDGGDGHACGRDRSRWATASRSCRAAASRPRGCGSVQVHDAPVERGGRGPGGWR